jgi:Ni,Fe-hydrogenase III small subunit
MASAAETSMSFDTWASRKVVNVSVFGNGISVTEWSQLLTSPWRHHGGFVVKLVDDPSLADVLAMHGPVTALSEPFLLRWASRRKRESKLLWVGHEAGTPLPALPIDLVVAGSPPSPGLLKASVERVLWGSEKNV